MTVIQTTTHPATGALETFAKGTIKRINIKRLNADGSPKVSTFKDKNTGQQKQINSTHMYSVLLEDGADGAWISFGTGEVKNLKYEDQFQIKTADGKYVDLLVGMVISVYPVSPRTYEVNGETKTAYEGKKKNLTILDSTNAVAKTQQGAPANAPAKTSAQNGATTKVYGEILTLDGTAASVKTDNGEVKVTLTQEQVAAVQVGGRLAGQVDGSGNIVSGFKVYGPAGSKPAGGGNKGFKKDDLAIRLGNALTITHAMFPEQHVINLELEVTQTLAVMDNLRSKLAAEFTHMDAFSLGARLGQSGILSAPFSRNGPDEFAENTESVFRMICTMEDNIRKGAEQASVANQTTQGSDGQGQQQVQEQQVNTPAPDVTPQPSMNYAPNPNVLDFDDDIPFAPIGLQYADHFIHSM